MNLFVIAALIAVSSAARLDHLEQQKLRAYLPPHLRNGNGANGAVGSNSNTLGVAGAGQTSFESRGSFPSDFTKYIPPNQGSTASPGTPDFAGSLNGFGQNLGSSLGDPSKPDPAKRLNQPDATAQSTNNLDAQLGVQPQPDAPSPSQEIPQQAFDEETGYHY